EHGREPLAAHAGHVRLHDANRARGRQIGVDSVPAASEDRHRRLGGEWMIRDDGAAAYHGNRPPRPQRGPGISHSDFSDHQSYCSPRTLSKTSWIRFRCSCSTMSGGENARMSPVTRPITPAVHAAVNAFIAAVPGGPCG